MLTIRPSSARGVTNQNWLTSYHTFSFGDYYDPTHRGFHSLRVINQDIVQPGAGFATHSHSDMEIITYVTKGAIAHKDSMGNETVIRAGEIQCMTAGTGVSHSEYNFSKEEPLELLQIWIFPKQKGLMPGYQQNSFDLNKKGLQLLGSEQGEQDSLLIHQDVKLWRGNFDEGENFQYKILPQRHIWLQLITGQLIVNKHLVSMNDGCSITDELQLNISVNKDSEFLLFDLW
jgi:redox-sensitive bicupin YhaK (pirin superfamily)